MLHEAKVSLNVIVAMACMALQASGCQAVTEHRSDASAGLNGGFEVVRDGLPVNWLFYLPAGRGDSQSHMTLDTVVFKEGRQSLKFEVQSITDRRPGFTNEFSDIGRFRGPAQYSVTFWAMNDGTAFVMSSGPVSATTGDMRAAVESAVRLDEWTEFTFTVDVPKDKWLRLQLLLLSPGSFWIDDVRIERVD